MFTGIVEELGRIVRLETVEDSARLTVEAPTVTQDVSLGDSVSVNGCCLTVAAVHGSTFTADLMAETLTRTTLGSQAPGERVNLEVDVLAKYAERLLGARPSQEGQQTC